jgi:hypothetical protein
MRGKQFVLFHTRTTFTKHSLDIYCWDTSPQFWWSTVYVSKGLGSLLLGTSGVEDGCFRQRMRCPINPLLNFFDRWANLDAVNYALIDAVMMMLGKTK